MTYGYARVSTKEQREDRQLIAMGEYGVDVIITDKESGKNFDRPGYKKLIKKLTANDTLVVESLDRLGRNYDEIIEQWRMITKNIGASIVVLDMPILNTDKVRDLMGTLISDIVLQLLSYVAQTEREFNHKRTLEGIAAAKARGVRFGREPIVPPENFKSVYNEWEKGNISATKAAEKCGVSRNTFLKWTRNDEIVSKGCVNDR